MFYKFINKISKKTVGINSYLTLLLVLTFIPLYSQSQEEILRDLREDNGKYEKTKIISKNQFKESLEKIYKEVHSALEEKEDRIAIEKANQLELLGITEDKMNIKPKAELEENQILYLKIRRLRAEAFYNLRQFKDAIVDSKFIVENHPRAVVFDFTRYAVSLYYLGEEKGAKRTLNQAKAKFTNQNDQIILTKTTKLLFPDY